MYPPAPLSNRVVLHFWIIHLAVPSRITNLPSRPHLIVSGVRHWDGSGEKHPSQSVARVVGSLNHAGKRLMSNPSRRPWPAVPTGQGRMPPPLQAQHAFAPVSLYCVSLEERVVHSFGLDAKSLHVCPVLLFQFGTSRHCAVDVVICWLRTTLQDGFVVETGEDFVVLTISLTAAPPVVCMLWSDNQNICNFTALLSYINTLQNANQTKRRRTKICQK